MTESQRRLAAIMFTDMVGYSALAQADEAASLAVLERQNRLLRPLFAKFRGREVKTVGDAFLVEFESALEAVRCAVEIQEYLHEYNLPSPDLWRIRIRIGIHVGDVVRTNGDVLGDAVNIASRIQPLADPDGICLTQQVYDQVLNKISVSFAKLPATTLKNIRFPMNIYKILPPWDVRPTEIPAPPSSKGRHIAVLPLANISPDPSDAYFADGLTEELISTLSQVHGLAVTARTSVAPYKTAPKSVAQVGTELEVETILEGSVRKAGPHLRITLQLIDVATQKHIWAASYNREIDDVFAVQTDIAERTAQALQLELAKTESAGGPRKPTTDLVAYDLYLRGLVASRRHGVAGLEEAVRCFEQATKLDPDFAEAYATWANLYVRAAGDFLPMREVMPRARELAARALKLNPESSEAHSALGNITLQFDNDWARAESEFRRAISLNPSNISAHSFLGLEMIALERFDEAKEILRRAVQLDPGGGHQRTLSWAELESGNFEVAIRYREEIRDADPGSVGGHVDAGLCYAQAGRWADALREADWPLVGASETERFDHALLNAIVGRTDEARAVAAEVERGEAKSYTSATDLAMLYTLLGEKTRALDLLEKDLREGDRILWLYYRGVYFDPIREDPRFVALLRESGLPTPTIRRAPATST